MAADAQVTASPPETSAFERVRIKLQEKKYEDIEYIWLEMMENGERRPEPFLDVAGLIIRNGQGESAGGLLMMLAKDWYAKGELEPLAPIAREAVEYAAGDPALPEILGDCLRVEHADRPDTEDLVKACRIDSPVDLKEALARFDSLLFYRPGEYVYHAGGYGVGRVARVEAETARVVVDFAEKKDHAIKYELARKILEKLSPDCYKALSHDQRDELKRMAREEPLRALITVLTDLGRPSPLRAVRERFLNAGFKPAEWTRLWRQARKLATEDPLIEVGPGNQPRLALRDKPLSRDEEDRLTFTRKAFHRDRLNEALAILARAKESDRRVEDPSYLHEYFLDRVSNGAPPERLEAWLFLERLQKEAGTPPPPGAMEDYLNGDVPELIGAMLRVEFQKEVLKRLRRSDENAWAETAANAFFTTTRELWDSLAADLKSNGQHGVLHEALGIVDQNSSEYPEQFLWMARQHFEGRLAGVWKPKSDIGLLERVIRILGDAGTRIEQASERSDAPSPRDVAIVKTYRAFLNHRDSRYVQMACENKGDDDLLVIESAVMGCAGMSESIREHIFAIVPHTRVAPEESHVMPSTDLPDLSATLYCTKQAIQRKQRELDRIIEVDIPAVERAIGAAKEQGDISENAEYDAALERSADLDRRKNELSADLARTQAIDLDEVDASRVSVGVRVELQEQDQRTTFTILGPWDADAERGVISYKSPIGQALLGLTVGESATVQLPDGERRLTVLNITKADGE